jgi:competence protein ComEA
MKRSSLLTTLTLLLSLMSGFAFAQSASININTADSTSLASLSGIGQSKAEAIVEYRKANGPFASTEELANVKGIGARTVEKNANRLTIQDTNSPKAP